MRSCCNCDASSTASRRLPRRIRSVDKASSRLCCLSLDRKSSIMPCIQILFNQSTGRYRCVMRRDTTLKLCANFSLSPKFKVTPKPNAPTIYTWGCRDYSDGTGPEGSDEIFTARFKDVAAGNAFFDCINEIVMGYKS